MTAGSALHLTGTMVCFFIGRFTGTWLHQSLRATQSPGSLRINRYGTSLISAFAGGHVGLIALTLCSAFMSIQYPTIFSLGIKNLGQDTKYGSSFIVMTIIGGGIVTLVMGLSVTQRATSPLPNWIRHSASQSSLSCPFRSQTATN